VTLTVKSKSPAADGVPVIEPLAPNDSPPGSDPPVTAQPYGARPPAALRVAEYPVPTVPAGKELVVMEGGVGAAPIVTRNDRVSDTPFWSVTCAVKSKSPAAFGVPAMDPFVISDNPPGKLPDATVHE
jgi:hypothetical protein